MTDDEIESELVKIAAGCFRKDDFPPMVVGDWELPVSVSQNTRRLIQRNLTQTDTAVHKIGQRVKRVLDAIRARKEQR